MTTPALVLNQDKEGGSTYTILHFGIGQERHGPTVAIQEASQMVFVTPENWPAMKAAMEKYFNENQTTTQNPKGKENE